MAAESQFTRVAAYGLIVNVDRLLLCRISKQVSNHVGFWTLPGGGIDFGEHPEDAMVRELKEETGLDVRASKLAGIDSNLIEDDEKSFHGIRIIYHAEQIGGELTNEVHGSTDRCAWWTWEECAGLQLVELAKTGLALAL